MPEEELETAELKESIEERVEAALEEHEKKEDKKSGAWIKALSLSTAIIAVFAAVASLMSGSYSNEAILDKSEAMLQESLASDQWALYQAKGIKGAIATGQAGIIADTKPDAAAKLMSESVRYGKEQEEIKKEALKIESEVKTKNEESAELMERHHKFAICVTLLQIAIALSAIAALTRRKPLWFVGLATSVGGVAMFVTGLL
jgi:Domain of unknown function (DUF4337)